MVKVNTANLDCSGMVVKRGSIVEWPIEAAEARRNGLQPVRVKVERVRGGDFWHSGWSTPSFTPCSGVRVVG